MNKPHLQVKFSQSLDTVNTGMFNVVILCCQEH